MSIRHALLALLSEGPKYGLQLRQEFESRTGEVWPLNVGQVYTTLQRLERDGLIESDDDVDDEGPQKGFHITQEGAEELAQWTRLKEDESRLDLNFALVVDAELFRLDSLIRWLDTADGRLKRAAAGVDAPASQSFPLPKLRRRVGTRP